MKTFSIILSAYGLATVVGDREGFLDNSLTPILTDVQQQLYQLEKNAIGDELKSWLAKWENVANKNGWIPVPTRAHMMPDEIQEQLEQRFFRAKQLVAKLKGQNPLAEFSTDSPFTLLPSDEFAAYFSNPVENATSGDTISSPPLQSQAFSFQNWSHDAWVPLGHLRDVPKPTQSSDPSTKIGSMLEASPRHLSASTGVDWSTSECMPPIQYQGQCGCCWAFASVAALETVACIAHGSPNYTKYSEQTLASCDRGNNGCMGGNPERALKYILTNGLCTLADDPYRMPEQFGNTCNIQCNRFNAGITAIKRLDSNEADLITALDRHPVVIGVYANNAAWKQYKSGVLSTCPSGYNNIDHFVLAVGYDATSIKIRNSWGRRWGEDGYIRLARSSVGLGTCRMFQEMVHPEF